MRLRLEIVLERLEGRRLAGTVGDGLREEPVREPRVPRQERAVQIGPERATEAAALIPALTIVAEAGDHAAKGLGSFSEVRPAGVVLEAGQRAALAGLELALEQDVADHAPLSRDRMERKEADSGQLVAALVSVEAPEQLVTAADGEKRGAGADRGSQCLAMRRKCGRDQFLLAVLSAADVVEVLLRPDRVARADGPYVELVPAPRRPPREDCDVAAIGVDVQVVRKQMPDDDLHAAASSQYGRTKPRRDTRSRRASIAV